MPVVEIFCHVLRDDGLVGFEEIEIFIAHFGRYLEADMQQLAQAAYQTQAESYAVIAKRVEENVQELKSVLQQQKK